MEAVKEGETCLVLTDRKAHCRELKDLILQRRKISTAVLTGETPKKERKQTTQFVNEGKIKVLIATGQLIGEGFDCKNLSSLFLTLPVKYSGRIIQYIGRVLRPKEGKTEAKIYDYFDPNIKCLYGGLKNREKEYKKLLV
jgi:superfamily II DNA or RNA helicase